MKRHLSLLMTCVLTVVLFGCADGGCTQTVQTQMPDQDVTFTDTDGTTYSGRTDANGYVTVPCGTKESVDLTKGNDPV